MHFGDLFASKITIDLIFGESTLILSTSKNREKRNGYGIVTIANNITYNQKVMGQRGQKLYPFLSRISFFIRYSHMNLCH